MTVLACPECDRARLSERQGATREAREGRYGDPGARFYCRRCGWSGEDAIERPRYTGAMPAIARRALREGGDA